MNEGMKLLYFVRALYKYYKYTIHLLQRFDDCKITKNRKFARINSNISMKLFLCFFFGNKRSIANIISLNFDCVN